MIRREIAVLLDGYLKAEKDDLTANELNALVVELASDLKAARKAAGVSVAEVAAAVGMTRNEIARLESGRMTNPTIDTLERYAKAVGRQLRVSVVQV